MAISPMPVAAAPPDGGTPPARPPGDVAFTRAGALAGARLSLPLALGGAAYGVVYGALARQAGISPAEAVLMSALVCAGAAQFEVLDLWAPVPPLGVLVLTTLVVNARHLLMSAALWPWFARPPVGRAYGSMFVLFDESWALTQRSLATGGGDGAVLIGSGATLWAAWVGSTGAGYAVGAVLGDPSRWGLGVAFTAVFAALLAGTWDGRNSVLPWAIGGGVALLADGWLGGGWPVLLGGLAGSLAGVVGDGD